MREIRFRTAAAPLYAPCNALTETSSPGPRAERAAARCESGLAPRVNPLPSAGRERASGLATSRLLPAILEQHQRADGTVLVPEVLRRWGLPELLRPA